MINSCSGTDRHFLLSDRWVRRRVQQHEEDDDEEPEGIDIQTTNVLTS
jgi:hypothetical protein